MNSRRYLFRGVDMYVTQRQWRAHTQTQTHTHSHAATRPRSHAATQPQSHTATDRQRHRQTERRGKMSWPDEARVVVVFGSHRPLVDVPRALLGAGAQPCVKEYDTHTHTHTHTDLGSGARLGVHL